ncbi:MAG: BadF/BadG/BcrA/BcrD ATPase family protein [Bacilli bacterium]|nr:BadF/BadG/BcrA/BcrD ATPase family protein [Bacilli bacterium]
MDYILGVDGGNTKTDYFLFNTNGEFIDFYRGGTCSHEGLPDHFEGSYRVMKSILHPFLEKHNLTPQDIKASVFGLAGVDTPSQKARLEEVMSRLGFTNFRVVNDSFLGIKAGAPNGIGVCSINGTGTSSSGIDDEGHTLQVGGIGAIVGDEAGGHYIARQVIRAVFDEAYRFGVKTSLTPIVFNYLGVDDKCYLMEKISEVLTTRRLDLTKLTIACFEEASKNDEGALQILKKMADNLARSAGGVVANMKFSNPVNIIMAGSVWVKGSCPVMREEFQRLMEFYTQKKCHFIVLNTPPATGAIIWALELVMGKLPPQHLRDQITSAVLREQDCIQAS